MGGAGRPAPLPRARVSYMVAGRHHRPCSLMSTLDVSGTFLAPGRSPTVRPVGLPNSTRDAHRHTSTAGGQWLDFLFL